MKIPVSERMKMVADLVNEVSCVADIGCDHAYTSMYLIDTKKANKVLAMDINQGPLEIAKNNIKKYGFEDCIETRRSNGAMELMLGEAQAILISGMGGSLIQQILSQSKPVVSQVQQLILQPQSEPEVVRHYLHENGYCINKEQMLVEEGKFYVAMRAVKGQEEYRHEYEYLYGRYLLKNKDEILYSYLKKEHKTTVEIINKLMSLSTVSEKSKARISTLQEQLKQIELAEGDYNEK